MHSSEHLVRELVTEDVVEDFIRARTEVREEFIQLGRDLPEKKGCQRSWDNVVCEETHSMLVQGATDPQNKARILAVSSSKASKWLEALPSPNLGTWLDNNTLRISVGLRLGAKVVEPHECQCGKQVCAKGVHGLSCRRSAGRWSRHSQINNTFARALRTAHIPVVLEPPGLSRSDGKRPDGVTQIPFERGRCLVWDGTVVDTLAPSYVDNGSEQPGTAAARAEVFKLRKYEVLSRSYIVEPLAFETLGGPGPRTSDLLKTVGGLLQVTTGNPRAGEFLRQRLSLDVQRGNAASVMGTLPINADTF